MVIDYGGDDQYQDGNFFWLLNATLPLQSRWSESIRK